MLDLLIIIQKSKLPTLWIALLKYFDALRIHAAVHLFAQTAK
jgi:hypothetical protein